MPDARYQIESARDEADRLSRMVEEVRLGLTARTPWLSSKYFYDDRGSRLFEDITGLVMDRWYADPEGLFALALLTPATVVPGTAS